MRTVKETALVQRINRQLAKSDERLHKARRFEPSLGDYYVESLRSGVVDPHIDPEALGRQLGVLRQYETIEVAA